MWGLGGLEFDPRRPWWPKVKKNTFHTNRAPKSHCLSRSTRQRHPIQAGSAMALMDDNPAHIRPVGPRIRFEGNSKPFTREWCNGMSAPSMATLVYLARRGSTCHIHTHGACGRRTVQLPVLNSRSAGRRRARQWRAAACRRGCLPWPQTKIPGCRVRWMALCANGHRGALDPPVPFLKCASEMW